MGYVPDDAQWFLAELVLEHRVAGEPRNVVHFNTVLIEANSPDEAWDRAMELGREADQAYVNTDGEEVQVRFRGLRDLLVVHEDLEHGAELLYEEHIGLPEDRLVEMIPARHELSVFEPLPEVDDVRHPAFRAGQPNLMPDSVAQALEGEVLSGSGALESAEAERAPSGEALRFARHAALVAASELRRQGLASEARGAEYVAQALEHLITLG